MLRLVLLSTLYLFSNWATAQTTFQQTINVDNGQDAPWSVLVEDDGYIICATGSAQIYNGWKAVKLFKTDFNGNLQWYKFHGKESQAWFSGFNGSFIKTGGGGFAVGGGIFDSSPNDDDAALIKFDKSGDTVFVKTFGGNRFDTFRQCRQTKDGGYILAGETMSLGEINGDVYLVKTDSLGNLEWEKTYGGSSYERATTIELADDGGYVIGGVTESFGPGPDNGYILKTDSLGNLEWDTAYGTRGDDAAGLITLSNDGGILIWGGLDTTINQGDFNSTEFVGKIDGKGNVLWWKYFGDKRRRNIWQLRELQDGNIVFIGERFYEPLFAFGSSIVKMDKNGNVLWERQYLFDKDTLNNSIALTGDFQQTQDGGFIIVGNVWNSSLGNLKEILLMKVDSNGCLENDCGVLVGVDEVKEVSFDVTVFPNPTSSHINITLPTAAVSATLSFSLYDLQGKQVFTKEPITPISQHLSLFVDHKIVPRGILLYELRSEGQVLGRGKLVLQ